VARKSIRVLDNTGTQLNVVGLPVKAAGYYGSGLNLHTFAVYLNNFSGRLFIDATLATVPTPDDWFTIQLNGSIPYIDYPYTQVVNPVTDLSGTSGIDSFSFDGNFTFIRARIDRTNLTIQYPLLTDFGSIGQILVNY